MIKNTCVLTRACTCACTRTCTCTHMHTHTHGIDSKCGYGLLHINTATWSIIQKQRDHVFTYNDHTVGTIVILINKYNTNHKP